jgi:CBS domain-containing protein
MKVSELMKKNPQCITADASLQEAARTMQRIDCGVLPVCEKSDQSGKNRPIGVITDRDIVIRCIAEDADYRGATVRDVMTRGTVSCDEDCSVKDAFVQMRSEKVGRLLVTDSKGVLIGILTLADIIARDPQDIWDRLPGAKSPQARQKHAA